MTTLGYLGPVCAIATWPGLNTNRENGTEMKALSNRDEHVSNSGSVLGVRVEAFHR